MNDEAQKTPHPGDPRQLELMALAVSGFGIVFVAVGLALMLAPGILPAIEPETVRAAGPILMVIALGDFAFGLWFWNKARRLRRQLPGRDHESPIIE